MSTLVLLINIPSFYQRPILKTCYLCCVIKVLILMEVFRKIYMIIESYERWETGIDYVESTKNDQIIWRDLRNKTL